jgi:hypothetical protein
MKLTTADSLINYLLIAWEIKPGLDSACTNQHCKKYVTKGEATIVDIDRFMLS